jgi:hypothetical protein
MDNPEELATLGTQDEGKQMEKDKLNIVFMNSKIFLFS